MLYREAHILLEELADATKQYMESVSTVALLIIDDFGIRNLPQTAAEDLLEILRHILQPDVHPESAEESPLEPHNVIIPK